MTQKALIAQIAKEMALNKQDVSATLDGLAKAVFDALKRGGEIRLPGIGKLKVVQRAARTVRNPQTGEAMEIPARRVVKFTPAKGLRDAVAGD